MNFKGRVLAVLVGAALLATVSTTAAYPTTTAGRIFYALRADGTIVSFDPASPGVVTEIPVYPPAGEAIVSIDLRSTGELYALTDRGTLFRVAPNVGLRHPVGASPILLVSGQARVDLDPDPDVVRLVTTDGQDYVFDPDTGEVESAVSGSSTAKLAASFGAASLGGVRYILDPREDVLLAEPGPGLVGGLGTDFNAPGAFDIAEESQEAFAVAIPDGETGSWLYSIDLESGKAEPLGEIGGFLAVVDLAAG